jgi:hypothetical protein
MFCELINEITINSSTDELECNYGLLYQEIDFEIDFILKVNWLEQNRNRGVTVPLSAIHGRGGKQLK